MGAPRRGPAIRLKHLVDRAAALGLVALSAPLALLIAALVKREDGGPVLFRQERPGELGQPFESLKFRTMTTDADSQLTPDGRPAAYRVTRVGGFLRRSSLDELPQLLNVVRGEMSIVGPRPPLMAMLDRLDDRQLRRFAMRPGMTGLAQISGRNTLKWSHRIALDIDYVENWSLGWDIRILAKTIGVVLTGSGVVLDRNPQEVDDLPAPGEWQGARH